MIELLNNQSPNVIAMKIVGKIEKSDMDGLIKDIQGKLEHVDKLGIYVELESFGGISLNALIEDIKFAFPNLKKFNKKAVVSDKEWLGKVVEVGNKFFPSMESRHFSLDQRDEALAWVKE